MDGKSFAGSIALSALLLLSICAQAVADDGTQDAADPRTSARAIAVILDPADGSGPREVLVTLLPAPAAFGSGAPNLAARPASSSTSFRTADLSPQINGHAPPSGGGSDPNNVLVLVEYTKGPSPFSTAGSSEDDVLLPARTATAELPGPAGGSVASFGAGATTATGASGAPGATGATGDPGAEGASPPAEPASKAVLAANLDFGGNIYPQLLPFDEYFSIRGTATEETNEVDVSYLEIRRRFRIRRTGFDEFECYEILKKKDRDTGARQERLVDPCPWVPLGLAETEKAEIADRDAPGGKKKVTRFVLQTVGPLKANYHYAFRYSTVERLTPAQEKELEKKAYAALSKQLGRATSLNIELEAFPAWQTALFAALKEIAASVGKGARFVGRSYFTQPWDNLPAQTQNAFITDTVDLAAANRAIFVNSPKNWRESRELYERDLRALAANRKTLAELIEELSKVDESFKNRIDATPPVRYLQYAADSPQWLQLLNGQNPLSDSVVPPAPADLATADPTILEANVATWSANYEQTERNLRELQSLFESVLKADGSRASLLPQLMAADEPLTEEQLTALRDPDSGASALLGNAADGAFELPGVLGRIKESVDDRAQAVKSITSKFSVQIKGAARLVYATTEADYETRQTWYLSADVGFAGTPEIDEVLRYIGMNVYFRPVNRQASFRTASSFGRRASLTLGLTEGGIGDTTTRVDLFGSNSLLVGAGYRVTEALRVGVGAVIFKEIDPNPLLADETLQFTPYLSLSFDWNIRNTMGQVGLFPTPENEQPEGQGGS